MGKKLKCAYIYLSQTSDSDGSFSGGGVGLGLNGPFVGGGGGNVSMTNQTKLAEMFCPVENPDQPNQESPFFMPMLGALVAIGITFLAPAFAIYLVKELPLLVDKSYVLTDESYKTIDNVKTIIQFMGAAMLVGSMINMQNSIGQIKSLYSVSEFQEVQNRYNAIDYDTEEHTVELNGVVLPATRANFEKLCFNKLS